MVIRFFYNLSDEFVVRVSSAAPTTKINENCRLNNLEIKTVEGKIRRD